MKFCSHWKQPRTTLKMRKLAFMALSVWLWDMNSTLVLMRYIILIYSFVNCVVGWLSIFLYNEHLCLNR